MNTLKIAALSAALSIAAPAAFAAPPQAPAAGDRVWYSLNFGVGKCVTMASMGYSNPEGVHSMLRQRGITDTVDAMRDANGALMIVTIQYRAANGGGVGLLFFPSAAQCEDARQNAIQAGTILDPHDMR